MRCQLLKGQKNQEDEKPPVSIARFLQGRKENDVPVLEVDYEPVLGINIKSVWHDDLIIHFLEHIMFYKMDPYPVISRVVTRAYNPNYPFIRPFMGPRNS